MSRVQAARQQSWCLSGAIAASGAGMDHAAPLVLQAVRRRCHSKGRPRGRVLQVAALVVALRVGDIVEILQQAVAVAAGLRLTDFAAARVFAFTEAVTERAGT